MHASRSELTTASTTSVASQEGKIVDSVSRRSKLLSQGLRPTIRLVRRSYLTAVYTPAPTVCLLGSCLRQGELPEGLSGTLASSAVSGSTRRLFLSGVEVSAWKRCKIHSRSQTSLLFSRDGVIPDALSRATALLPIQRRWLNST